MKKKLLLISLAVMTVGNMVAHIFENINETGNYPSGEGLSIIIWLRAK